MEELFEHHITPRPCCHPVIGKHIGFWCQQIAYTGPLISKLERCICFLFLFLLISDGARKKSTLLC